MGGFSHETKVIRFPLSNKHSRKRTKKNYDDIKYFNNPQIKLLRRTARNQAELDSQKGKVTGIREWMAIDLLTSTGIRVSECADIQIEDLKVGYGQSEIFIKNGKGSKPRTIQIPQSLKTHLKSFLKWKKG